MLEPLIPDPRNPALLTGPRPVLSFTPRLRHLADGQEFPLGDRPFFIGRHSTSDIQLKDREVSRRHVELIPSSTGYRVRDHSVNGILLNGAPLEGERVLLLGDVLTVGGHRLMFIPGAPKPAPQPVVAPPPPPSTRAPAPGPPKAVAERTVMAAAPPLATIFVWSGHRKGEAIPIAKLTASVGRSQENDLVLPDEEVSGTHAIFERRDGRWLLSDLGSSNGSYVDGQRVKREVELRPGATIRLGETWIVFQPFSEGPVSLEPAGEPRRRRSSGKRELVTDLPPEPGFGLGQWLRRYWLAEGVGALAAVGGAYGIQTLSGNEIAAAYAGSICELLGFYLIAWLGEQQHDAHQANLQGRRYGVSQSFTTLRNLLFDFGPAELLDTGLVRPLAMGVGSRFLGLIPGVLAGKLLADLLVYLPLTLVGEWRRRRSQ